MGSYDVAIKLIYEMRFTESGVAFTSWGSRVPRDERGHGALVCRARLQQTRVALVLRPLYLSNQDEAAAREKTNPVSSDHLWTNHADLVYRLCISPAA